MAITSWMNSLGEPSIYRPSHLRTVVVGLLAWVLVASAELLLTRPVGAQDAAAAQLPPTQGTAPELAAVGHVSGALVVLVYPGNSDVNPTEVRNAIARELKVEVAEAPGAGAHGTMTVTLGDREQLTIRFRSADGDVDVERTVELPPVSRQKIEIIALLSGNLARNEAGELLAGLEHQEPESATVTPPTPATPARPPSQPPRPTAIPHETLLSPRMQAPSPCQLARSGREQVRGFHASLFYPSALDPQSHLYRYRTELGLVYSRIGGLWGAGFDIVYLRTEGAVLGLAAAGIVAEAGEPLCGAQLGGVGTVGHGDLQGSELAGVFTWRNGAIRGSQVAGVLAAAGSIKGAQISGGAAITRGSLTGSQLGPLFAWVGGDAAAGQLGTLALARGSLDGFQLSGLVSYAGGPVKGLQITGGYNHAGDLQGAQIGLVNRAGRVRGLQVGLVNVSQQVDGLALALVSVVLRGRTQLTTWADGPGTGNGVRANLGVKYQFRPMYTLLAVGGDATEPSTSASYGIGAHLPLRPFFVDADILYSFVGDRYLKEAQKFHARHELRYRALLGTELIPGRFGVFAGGAAEQGIDWSGQNLGWRPEALAGIQVF